MEIIREGTVYEKGPEEWAPVYLVLSSDGQLTHYENESKEKKVRAYTIQGGQVISYAHQAYADDNRSGSIFGVSSEVLSTAHIFEVSNDVERYKWVEALAGQGAEDGGLSKVPANMHYDVEGLDEKGEKRGADRESPNMLFPVKEAYLFIRFKPTAVIKQWRQIYFILTEQKKVGYYVNDKRRDKLISYDVEGAKVLSYSQSVFAEEGRPGYFFSFQYGNEIIVLEAPSEKERYQWIEALQRMGAEDLGMSKKLPDLLQDKKDEVVIKDGEVLKEGYLVKRFTPGSAIQQWEKKYFAVVGKEFGYYLSLTQKVGLKSFPVNDSVKIVSFTRNLFQEEGREGYFFGVTPPNGETMVLETETEKDRYDWLEIFLKLGATDVGLSKTKPDSVKDNSKIDSSAVAPKKTATSSLKEGYIWKRFQTGAQNKTWQQYYFVLYGEGQLGYYPNDHKREHLVLIMLDRAKTISFTQEVFKHEGRPGFFFGIVLPQARETMILEADTETERYEWLEALNANGALSMGLSKSRPEGLEDAAVPEPEGNQNTEEESKERQRWIKNSWMFKRFKPNAVIKTWKKYLIVLLDDKKIGFYQPGGPATHDRLVAMDVHGVSVWSFAQSVFAGEGRDGFFFGLLFKGDPWVLEAQTEKERYEWLEQLGKWGAVDEGMTKALPQELQEHSGEHAPHAMNGDILREGYLWKRFKPGSAIQQWERKYFVMVDTHEFGFFPNDKNREKPKTWNIEKASIVSFTRELFKEEGRSGYFFSVTPVNTKETLVLETESDADRYQWIELLSLHGAIDKGLSKTKPALEGEEKVHRGSIVAAHDEDGVKKEGWLYKRFPLGSAERTWQKYYFELAGNSFGYYFNDKKKKNELTSIPTNNIHVVSFTQTVFGDERPGYFFAVIPQDGTESWYLEASSEKARYEWLELLNKHGAVDDGLLRNKPDAILAEEADYKKKIKEERKIEGWLWRKGRREGWKRRYWTLTRDTLLGRDDESYSGEVKKTYLIEGAKVISFTAQAFEEEGRSGSLFGITVPGQDRTQLFEAKDETERYKWIEALQTSGALDCGMSTHKPEGGIRDTSGPEGKMLKEGDVNQRHGKKWRSGHIILYVGEKEATLVYKNEKEKAVSVTINNARVVSFTQQVYADEKEGGKLGYFFGILATNSEPLVFEANSEKERYEWLEIFQKNGAIDSGLCKTPIDSLELSSGPANVVKEGVLCKRGRTAKRWNNAYFTLHDNGRLTYKKVDDKVISFSILGGKVYSYARMVYEEEGREGFLFAIRPANTQYELLIEAPSEVVRYEWVEALQKQGAADQGMVDAILLNPMSLKEGFLMKRGGKMKTWNKRYFILLSKRIQYFKSRTDETPAGEIILDKDTEVMKDDSKEDAFIITSQKGGRQYQIQASSPTDFANWVQAIKFALSLLTEDQPVGSNLCTVPTCGMEKLTTSPFCKAHDAQYRS